MDDVGKSPNHRDAEEGDAQEYDVQQADAEDVGQPDAPAVHDTGVGIHLAVRCSHIHLGSRVTRAPLELKQSQVSAGIAVPSVEIPQVSSAAVRHPLAGQANPKSVF